MSKTIEELQKELDEMTQQLQDSNRKLERSEIQRDAAESLIKNNDLGGRNSKNRLRDSSGRMSLTRLIDDGKKATENNSDSDFEKEVTKLTEEILSKITDEQMQDPVELRKLIGVLSVKTGSRAFIRARTDAIDIFQKAVNIKTNIDAILEVWRKNHPDLANPEDEDMVEWILMNKIATDPVNENKPLATLLELATEKAKEIIEKRSGEKKVENKEPVKTGVRTLTPGAGAGSGAGAGGKTEKEVNDMTDQERAARYIESRRNFSNTRQWNSRKTEQ